MEAEDLKQLEETLNELTIDLDKLDELIGSQLNNRQYYKRSIILLWGLIEINW